MVSIKNKELLAIKHTFSLTKCVAKQSQSNSTINVNTNSRNIRTLGNSIFENEENENMFSVSVCFFIKN